MTEKVFFMLSNVYLLLFYMPKNINYGATVMLDFE